MGFGINGTELVVLLLVIVIVAGPEKLPEFAQQLARLTRELKKLATGARERVREELGPEFDDMDLTVFDPRQYDPRRIVRDALLEGEPPKPRPRPRADRRGVTAPRAQQAQPSAQGAQQAQPSPQGVQQAQPSAQGAQNVAGPTANGSTAVGGVSPLAPGGAGSVASGGAGSVAPSASAPLAPGGSTPQRSQATDVPRQAQVYGGPTGAPYPEGAQGAAAAPVQHQGQGSDLPSGASAGATARPLSPREIVARTRGVRPAAESPAVVAALGAVGISPQQIRDAHEAEQAAHHAAGGAVTRELGPVQESVAAQQDDAAHVQPPQHDAESLQPSQQDDVARPQSSQPEPRPAVDPATGAPAPEAAEIPAAPQAEDTYRVPFDDEAT